MINNNNKLYAGGRHDMHPPPPCKLTISSYLFVRWHLLRHVGYFRHQQQVELGPFDLESGVRVTCATSVPILVFLGLSVLELGSMDVTDVRQKHRLMPPPYGGEGINAVNHIEFLTVS